MTSAFWARLLATMTARVCCCSYVIFLVHMLEVREAGIALLVLSASWVVSRMILVKGGSATAEARSGLACWQSELASLLLKWLVFCVVVAGLAIANLLSPFLSDPLPLLLLAGLPLLLALRSMSLTFWSSVHQKPRRADVGYPVLVSGLSLITVETGAFQADTFLTLHAVALLALLLVMWWRSPTLADTNDWPKESPTSRVRSYPSIELLPRYVDLLMLPLVISHPSIAVSYLIAKGMAEPIGWVFQNLEKASAARLRMIYASHGDNGAFTAAAARINLGFLLTGGGVAIAVLGVGSIAAYALGVDPDIFMAILAWLVIGQCAPVFFGATGLLLNVAEMHRMNALLAFSVTLVAAICIHVVGGADSVVIARTVAICQLALALMSAIPLALSHGVWPGLTAILCRRIRIL